MRQEHETATSFDELKAITQAIMLKKGALTNATNQANANERLKKTQENANAKAHTPEPTQKTGLKPKTSAQTKKGALKPTKRAFSERQITAFRDHSQASDEKRLKTEQGNNSSLRAKPSNKAFKSGLATHQSNQKGGNNEA
ncbi:hypothetical protein [Helicobacter pylori]|uniref:hypothetical protein n=1 Tax=Helicobacter pylori TaxID=210 RepID=UPI00165BC662|nr:hypothetical protein [Helicobacter pylori]